MLCVCIGGGVRAAEGLVSVKLSSSCMSDWPPLRPNAEYRQVERKVKRMRMLGEGGKKKEQERSREVEKKK